MENPPFGCPNCRQVQPVGKFLRLTRYSQWTCGKCGETLKAKPTQIALASGGSSGLAALAMSAMLFVMDSSFLVVALVGLSVATLVFFLSMLYIYRRVELIGEHS